MSVKPENINDSKNQAREYLKLTQTNIVNLAGLCTSKTKIEGKTKMKDNVAVTDQFGNIQKYPDRYKMKISFVGGEIETEINKDHYEMVQENEMYLLKGRLGMVKEYGNESVSYIFTTVEEL